MPLQIKPSSGSGSITLQATTGTTTNDTLTLPAKTGNIITSADSGTVTQTMLGTNVAGNGPAFKVYPSASQSVSTNTTTKVNNDTKDFDKGGCFNNTGSTVTLNGLSVPAYAFCPNIAGYYMFVGNSYFSGSSGASQPIIFRNTGATALDQSLSGAALTTAGTFIPSTGMFYLNGTGDYVTFNAYQSSGSTQTTLANRPDVCYFYGFLVRAA